MSGPSPPYGWDWLNQIQRKFDAYANGYRAQVAGLIGDGPTPADQEGTIERDLVALQKA